MVAGTLTLSEFKADIEDWNSYVEQTQFFFIANGITHENSRKQYC